MQERWRQVEQGQGQVTFVAGEAGIGKSRLVQRLKDGLSDRPYQLVECRCSPYYQHTAFYPVVDMLQRLLGIDAESSESDSLEGLKARLESLGLDGTEHVGLLAAFVGLALPSTSEMPWSGDPQVLRQRTMETLLTLVLALCEREPVLLVVEDAHWLDASTLEWLGLLVDQGPTAALLTLITSRPVFQSPWIGRGHVTSLSLHRLSQPQVVQMVGSIAGTQVIPPMMLEQIVSTTDGVPLFVEEMTQLLLTSETLERGDVHHDASSRPVMVKIPVTLQDSLTARLDAVGQAKCTAQLAAAIGREFSYALLRAVSPLSPADLQRDLEVLLAADLIYQRSIGARAEYQFKHALIQESAYGSLLRRTRQDYHYGLAETMEAQFPQLTMSQPELIAHHYMEAGEYAKAVRYWHQAGDHATQRSAHPKRSVIFARRSIVSTDYRKAPTRSGIESFYMWL